MSSKKKSKRPKDSRHSNRYVGNQLMIDKVMSFKPSGNIKSNKDKKDERR